MTAPLRILMPSIVDPATFAGGAGAATRGLVALLTGAPFHASVTVIATPTRSRVQHLGRQLTSLTRATLNGAPAKVVFHDSGVLRRQMRAATARDRFDVALVNGTDMGWVLDELPSDLPRALVVHNMEHEVYGAQMGRRSVWNGLLRHVLTADWHRLREFEHRVLMRTSAIFLSHHDLAHAQAHRCHQRVVTVPPVFAYPLPDARPRQPSHDRLRLGLVANFAWWPNRDAARWFIDQVLPQLDTTTELHLFGPRSEDFSARHPRVIAHGFLARLSSAFDTCDLMICPVRVGGGVSVKLAEALYHRAPVVATPFAARGLPVFADDAVVLLEGADAWIDFLRSPAARDLAGRQVSAAIARQFSLEAVRQPVAAFLSGVCGRAI